MASDMAEEGEGRNMGEEWDVAGTFQARSCSRTTCAWNWREIRRGTYGGDRVRRSSLSAAHRPPPPIQSRPARSRTSHPTPDRPYTWHSKAVITTRHREQHRLVRGIST